MLRTGLITLALLSGAAAPALAATAAPPPSLTLAEKMELRQNCGPDIRKLCGNVSPGDGRVAACMRTHRDELNKACKATLAKLMPPVAH
ncbi:hypothetical protein [Acidimangrovimonas sediminis]|uniref:hypothetical protein n=1 Tax=Acidimangrovimonas sediminis TaxID=2056283 RepID=UPI0011AF1507|nr:hypothetical protein [Acidimangrovimonas sediminis]